MDYNYTVQSKQGNWKFINYFIQHILLFKIKTMKNMFFLLLLFPCMGIAQLNYEDLKFLADNKADKNIEYIKNKGYILKSSRDIDDGTKMMYYEKSKLSKTLIALRIGSRLSNILSYVPENKTNFDDILNIVKKSNFKKIDSNSTDKDSCYKYESSEYFSKFCEVKFSNSNEISYNITFYRNDVDLLD
jgi:hypothetical protein